METTLELALFTIGVLLVIKTGNSIADMVVNKLRRRDLMKRIDKVMEELTK